MSGTASRRVWRGSRHVEPNVILEMCAAGACLRDNVADIVDGAMSQSITLPMSGSTSLRSLTLAWQALLSTPALSTQRMVPLLSSGILSSTTFPKTEYLVLWW